MFILRSPPLNPPGFRDVYLREKFNRFGEKLENIASPAIRSSVSGTQAGYGEYEISLLDLEKGRVKEFQVARLMVQTDRRSEINLRFRLDDGSVLEGGRYLVSSEKPAFYFELPEKQVKDILLSVKGDDSKHLLRFRDLEIRRIGKT